MYRIPRSKMSPDNSEQAFSEGRVLAEKDGILILQACHDEDPRTGDWRGEQKTYSISVERVMKINDWLLTMRYPMPPPPSSYIE